MPSPHCCTRAVPIAYTYTYAYTDSFTHTYGDTDSIADTNTVGNSEPYGNANLYAHAVRQRDNRKRWIRDRQLPTVGHS